MKTLLLILALLMPASSFAEKPKKNAAASKPVLKEISPSRLPGGVTKFISVNLPHATITKAVKQKRNPKEKYIVTVHIKAFTHTLVFDKNGAFVRLVKKK